MSDVQINEERNHIVRCGRWTLTVMPEEGRFNLEWREAFTYSEHDMPNRADLDNLQRALTEADRIMAGDPEPGSQLFPESDVERHYASTAPISTIRDEDRRRVRDGEVTPNRLREELGLPPVAEPPTLATIKANLRRLWNQS